MTKPYIFVLYVNDLNVKEQLSLLSAIEETVRLKTRKDALVNIQVLMERRIRK